jgi:hypothetical protein
MTPAAALMVDAIPAGPCPPRDIIGIRNTINRCGGWPDAGTVQQFLAAVDRAKRQVARIENIAARYARRFGLPDAGIDAAPWRLQVRHCVARQILAQRAEHSRMLIRDPIGGTA